VTVWLITGTDTEVGKTYVSACMLRWADGLGLRAIGLKPIASGCAEDSLPYSRSEELQSTDALALIAASSVPMTHAQCCAYAFAPPISPHLAARAAGVVVELSALSAHISRAQQRHQPELTVIEGAGGWLSPLAEGVDHADLAKACGAEVILVVAIRLGCINHARLSELAITHAKQPMLGWIANVMPGTQNVAPTIAALRELLRSPMLARVDTAGFQPTAVLQAWAKKTPRVGRFCLPWQTNK
jgi:dethiobiotin synthetase